MVNNKGKVDVSVTQCRMARYGLRLGVRDLAKMADVSPNSIARFERGEKMHRRTVKAIKESLEKAGAIFFTTHDDLDAVAIRENTKSG